MRWARTLARSGVAGGAVAAAAAVLATTAVAPSLADAGQSSGDRTAAPVTLRAYASALQRTATSETGGVSRQPSADGVPTPLAISASSVPLRKLVGQLVIGSYAGGVPPRSLIRAVRAGRLGAVILMGGNTAGGVGAVHTATRKLQAAARAGGNPGLLIMTDQEGGEVKRLAGPPRYSAAQMGSPSLAHRQGIYTARLLKRAGVNMDLAPVADVARRNGFIRQEQRAFGRHPKQVAAAACAFARGLASQGVAYTLKHFPGLGSALGNTDLRPVNIRESARKLTADAAAYRKCGSAPLAAVMVASASYRHLTGRLPAVLASKIYRHVLPGYGVTALPISDSFESGAIQHLRTPARRAINAGLDMVMYPGSESVALYSYSRLLADARSGALHLQRIRAAYARVMKLKRALGLD